MLSRGSKDPDRDHTRTLSSTQVPSMSCIRPIARRDRRRVLVSRTLNLHHSTDQRPGRRKRPDASSMNSRTDQWDSERVAACATASERRLSKRRSGTRSAPMPRWMRAIARRERSHGNRAPQLTGMAFPCSRLNFLMMSMAGRKNRRRFGGPATEQASVTVAHDHPRQSTQLPLWR